MRKVIANVKVVVAGRKVDTSEKLKLGEGWIQTDKSDGLYTLVSMLFQRPCFLLAHEKRLSLPLVGLPKLIRDEGGNF